MPELLLDLRRPETQRLAVRLSLVPRQPILNFALPLVMDPGTHNAAYLAAKRTKLGHLMGQGPSCPVGGPTAVVAWHGQLEGLDGASLEERVSALALAAGLQCQVEDDPRLLALLNRPQVALLLSSGSTATALESFAGHDLQRCLEALAQPQGSRCVSLLLSPDPQRLGHPSASLEPERRPLAELRGPGHRIPPLSPGTLIQWQR